MMFHDGNLSLDMVNLGQVNSLELPETPDGNHGNDRKFHESHKIPNLKKH